MEGEQFKGKCFAFGNSIGLTIPKNIVEFLDLKPDDFVDVNVLKADKPTPEPKENAVKTDYGDRFKVEEKEG